MATDNRNWPLERVLFALAGSVVLISAALTLIVSKWLVLIAALVGVNQWLYVLAGWCPASLILRKACRLQSAIYQAGAAVPDAKPVSPK